MEIGKQYENDNDFKRKARLHQSKYRANILKVDCDVYGNMLKKSDAKSGMNFYNDFDILQSVHERFGPKYNKQLYANLLRSEHIPFNFFVPFNCDLNLAKNVFNEIIPNSNIAKITKIKIEYAPEHPEKYLNDRTSFDAYIKYQNTENKSGVIGIEVKYTEQAYPLKEKSKEQEDIINPKSKYYEVTEKSGLFVHGSEHHLIKNDYRQIWRNHLLGESIKQNNETEYFISATIFPSGNKHFEKVIQDYQGFLKKKNTNSVIGITFEKFFTAIEKHTNNKRFNDWVLYLKNRYIIS